MRVHGQMVLNTLWLEMTNIFHVVPSMLWHKLDNGEWIVYCRCQVRRVIVTAVSISDCTRPTHSNLFCFYCLWSFDIHVRYLNARFIYPTLEQWVIHEGIMDLNYCHLWDIVDLYILTFGIYQASWNNKCKSLSFM